MTVCLLGFSQMNNKDIGPIFQDFFFGGLRDCCRIHIIYLLILAINFEFIVDILEVYLQIVTK